MSKVSLTILSLMIISCGGTTHEITSGSLSNGNTFQVNRYIGCCGCEANYFVIKSGNRNVEQVIFKYNCGQGGTGTPTKYVFLRDGKGKLKSGDKYIATMSDDFSIPLTEDEKKMFQLVDSSGMLSQILGFRKPKANEPNHPFPLIKNGHKLKLDVD